MRLTRHADRRRIQRSLPIEVVSTIHAYGTERHAKGALSLTLDGRAIALAAEHDRRLSAELERYRGAYIIVASGDRVVTAARRTRRFRR
ncbi:hypothetical protein C4N9_06200 [Pararhodobacter marinus]|uniref:DUF4258 domain-containing protein n=1 Tax=Pararhodobacter marinus TaxID=2184063 RepID=A0A2U2CEM6_9RHOB|nr:hypothetical protein [Pararhodobacter marinus]PWE30279.1 hypothetical protein C4N9_06200 [Pararhodobacter marinus]